MLIKQAIKNKIQADDKVAFLLEWAKSPLRTASVVPSGQALARTMVAGVPDVTQPVIELGPGTGVFTEALIKGGVKPAQLTLVEANANFAARLRCKYPTADVIQGFAQSLGHLESEAFGAVVSGLPLLSMRQDQVQAILAESFRLLGKQGVFVQFTYGPKCPVPKEVMRSLGLSAKRTGFALKNFPPASVFTVQRDFSLTL